MTFFFQQVSSANASDFVRLFDNVFGKNIDAKRVSMEKKLETSYTGQSGLSVLAYDETGELAGALGLYPVLYSNANNELRVAAQIGDAMVYPKYRRNNLFTKMIEEVVRIGKAHAVDFIFTFPSTLNQGSYKGFVNSGFEDSGTLKTFTLDTRAGLLPRLIRKCSQRMYSAYENSLMKSADYSGPSASSLCIARSVDYLTYKSFNANRWVVLQSGKAWISICTFHLLIADYVVDSGEKVQDLVSEVAQLASRMGKDYIQFCTCDPTELTQLDTLNWTESHENIRLMVYTIHKNELPSSLSFNYADIDVF